MYKPILAKDFKVMVALRAAAKEKLAFFNKMMEAKNVQSRN